MDLSSPAVGSRWHGLKAITPKLAQPWWYKLVGYQVTAADNPLDAIDIGCLAPDEKRQMRREARKRFKRSAKAAIATQRKRSARRKVELLRALKVA